MRTFAKIAIAAVFAGAMVQAADAAVVTDTAVFALDTLRVVRSQAELDALFNAVYAVGETVTMTSPAGAESTLVSAAAEDGTVEVKTHIDAGGRWTFANSVQGTAAICVRHSIFGTLGEGTTASPAILTDGQELVDLAAAGTAGDGYVFDASSVDGLFDELVVPPGYRLESAGEGLWRIVESADGALYVASAAYSIDTRQEGPDRLVVAAKEMLASWSPDEIGTSAGAAMTLVSPSGVETSYPVSGAEEAWAQPIVLRETGVWHLTLSRGSSTWESDLTVRHDGFVIIIN